MSNLVAWLKNQERQKAPSQSTVLGHVSKGMWVTQVIAGWGLFVSSYKNMIIIIILLIIVVLVLVNRSHKRKKRNATIQPAVANNQPPINKQTGFIKKLLSIKTSKDFIDFQKERLGWGCIFIEILILIVLLIFFWYIVAPLLAIATVWLINKWNKKKKINFSLICLGVMVILTSVMFYLHRPPTIHINEPQNNIAVQKSVIEMKGSVIPKNASIKINSNKIKNTDGNFSYSIKLSEGENTTKISAKTWFKKEVNLVIKRELTQAEQDAKIKAEKEAQEQARIAKEKAVAEQKAWENSWAGRACKTHPDWTKEECNKLANGKIWIGMKYEMLKYRWGKPNSANPSNYGNGSEWQYCWTNYTPSCYYDDNNDGIIDAYN